MYETQIKTTTGGVKRIQATCDYVGLGRSKLYMLVSAGLFPQPISLGPTKAKAWLVCELDEWLMQQASRRVTQVRDRECV